MFSIDGIAISQQKAGRGLLREGFNDLLSGPEGSWVGCHIEVDHLPEPTIEFLMRTFGICVSYDRAEPLLVFRRGGKRTDHRMLLGNIPQRRAAYLAQPEQKSSNVRVAP